MADAEAADESASGKVPPALGDEGGVQEVGRLRGEAEEDLVEEVVVVQRSPHRRRRGGAAARHVHWIYWMGECRESTCGWVSFLLPIAEAKGSRLKRNAPLSFFF
jgi:hypothetical protein